MGMQVIGERPLKGIEILLLVMLLPGCGSPVEETVPDAWKHLVKTGHAARDIK